MPKPSPETDLKWATALMTTKLPVQVKIDLIVKKLEEARREGVKE